MKTAEERRIRINAAQRRRYAAKREVLSAAQRAYEQTPEGKAARAKVRERFKKNRPDYQFARNLKQNFGISIEDYEKIAIEQRRLCAICETAEVAVSRHTGMPRRLAVDHDHSAGKIRGLLCTACNTGIGIFSENASLMIKAIAYLERHSGEQNVQRSPPPHPPSPLPSNNAGNSGETNYDR